MSDERSRGWNNPSAPPSANKAPLTHEQMAARLHDIEALCADVYSVGVELGLPRDLLNRLWVIAGGGTAPQAFALDPAHAQQQVQVQAPRTQAPPAPAGLPPLKRRRTVLVVDDDPRMLDVLIRILGRENYELITADSGHSASPSRSFLAIARTSPVLRAKTESRSPTSASRIRRALNAVSVTPIISGVAVNAKG